ncbi:urease accessory protein UreF [Aestuariibius insulae]|uniref:urease accessory protein UreF n=1 Tax=Aestuariibius insulae TaxID=2058287 RepID=UPI00398E3E1B
MVAQWLSPSSPTGGFSFSQGLEAAVSDGLDVSGLEDWIDGMLRFGSGRTDAILMASAARGEEVDDLALALAGSAGRRRELTETGAALQLLLRDSFALETAATAYPVVLGEAVRVRGLPVEPVAALYLQATVTALVHAGQRLLPLGQSRAQAMIHALGAVCCEIAEEAARSDIEEIGMATFSADIAAMRQAELPVRLFRS